MSFDGPSTSASDKKRITEVKTRVLKLARLVERKDWVNTVPTLLSILPNPFEPFSQESMRDSFSTSCMVGRAFGSQYMPLLCRSLEDQQERIDYDACMFVKALLEDTGGSRLVPKRFVPTLFVTTLQRFCWAATGTPADLRSVQGNRHDIVSDHVHVSLDLCRFDPDGCRTALDKEIFFNFQGRPIQLQAVIQRYLAIQDTPDRAVRKWLGYLQAMLRIPIVDQPAIVAALDASTRAAGDIEERKSLAEAAVKSLLKEGESKIPAQGCLECGRKPTSGNKDMFKYCGACKSASYCSQVCAKTAWKAGHKERCVRFNDQSRLG